MKKLLVVIAVIAMLGVGADVNAKKTKDTIPEVPVLTEVQKIDRQIQALTQKRQQYLQAVQGIEIEIIKLQAVKGYILEQELKEDTKKK